MTDAEPLSKTGERPPDEPVSRPTGCVGCGYNLFGLPRDGRCPECGTPVWDSAQRPASSVPREDWDGLLRGAGWLAAATALAPACIAVEIARLMRYDFPPAGVGAAEFVCFLATLVTAAMAEARLYPFARKYRLQNGPPVDSWSALAAAGLLLLALDGLLLVTGRFAGPPPPTAAFFVSPVVTIAFGCLTLGVGRFHAFYRRHGKLLAMVSEPVDGKFLAGYGVWKLVIDGWLIGSVFVSILPWSGDYAGLALCLSLPALLVYFFTWFVEAADRVQLLARVVRLRAHAPQGGRGGNLQ